MLVSRGARSGGALIKGVIPADERTVGDLLQSVKEGSAEALEPVGSGAGGGGQPTLHDETVKDGAPGLVARL